MGLIASAVFIITAVYEVVTSSRIRQQEKVMWTIALILGGSISGILYIILGRKRVASHG